MSQLLRFSMLCGPHLTRRGRLHLRRLDNSHLNMTNVDIHLVKGKVCIWANVAHQAGAFPSFCTMKRLGVFLLPPGRDASPSQGYPPALSLPVPIYTPSRTLSLHALDVK